MRWVALMPLRAGSKSIPRKNTKIIAGKPLFSWSLGEAVKADCFDEMVVATDCPETAALVKKMFRETVTVIGRSSASATDTAATEQVMLEYQEQADFDALCLVQATSPLTRAQHYREARTLFETGDYDSLVTVAPFRRLLWDRAGNPLNYDPASRPRRQDCSGVLVENGAFYFTRAQVLRTQRCRLGGAVAVYEMPEETLVEVDEPEDWLWVEELLLRLRRIGDDPELEIRGLVVDVDGTLTDGGMYYFGRGEAMKKFDTRDAKGLELLRARGIRVAVITAENSAAVHSRMQKLQITEYYPGVSDKLPTLRAVARGWEIALANIAFIGDDVGDKQCLQAVGLAACPADAVGEIRACVDYVCAMGGGNGAVRELCDLILERHSDNERQQFSQVAGVAVERPWGGYKIIETGTGYQVKKLSVLPHRRISLQLHHKRSEHWVVTKGTATVTLGDEVFDLEVNEAAFIPLGVIHRLENRTDSILELIEVQVGAYLGEDDIVRLDDDFNR